MLREIPLTLIEGNPTRLNAESEQTDDLVISFSLHGQLSPILVRPNESKKGNFLVVYGNRRLSAARKLNWCTIKAEVVTCNKTESLVFAFLENIVRKDFSDYEKALILEKIHRDTGKSYPAIAALIGRSQSFVSQHVAMLRLFSNHVASEVERTKVVQLLSERHARILLRISDPLERWSTAKLAVAANLSVRELEKMVARFLTKENHSKYSEETRYAEREIKQLIKNFTDGINRGDISSYFESRSRRYFSMFDDFASIGRLDREKAESLNFRTIRNADEFSEGVHVLEVKMIGQCALALMSVDYHIRINGSLFSLKSRVTLVFSRDREPETGERQWKLVHEHWSLTEPSYSLLEKMRGSLSTQLEKAITPETNMAILNRPIIADTKL